MLGGAGKARWGPGLEVVTRVGPQRSRSASCPRGRLAAALLVLGQPQSLDRTPRDRPIECHPHRRGANLQVAPGLVLYALAPRRLLSQDPHLLRRSRAVRGRKREAHRREQLPRERRRLSVPVLWAQGEEHGDEAAPRLLVEGLGAVRQVPIEMHKASALPMSAPVAEAAASATRGSEACSHGPAKQPIQSFLPWKKNKQHSQGRTEPHKPRKRCTTTGQCAPWQRTKVNGRLRE